MTEAFLTESGAVVSVRATHLVTGHDADSRAEPGLGDKRQKCAAGVLVPLTLVFVDSYLHTRQVSGVEGPVEHPSRELSRLVCWGPKDHPLAQ